MKKELEDNRSKRFVFLPFCVMAQAFQARGIVKYEWKSSIKPILQELIDNDVNIVQLPCPESLFGEGLGRSPKGYSYYNNEEFNVLCERLALEVFDKVKMILDSDYEVVAIMGIEMSPSCALNYQYTNKGMVKMKGVFMKKLFEKVSGLGVEIPFIGINRKYVNKSLNELRSLL